MVYTERAMVESGNCEFFYTQRGHCGTMYVAHSTSAVTDTTANGNKIYSPAVWDVAVHVQFRRIQMQLYSYGRAMSC